MALRLEPGEEIYAIAADQSVLVVSCVGSVTSVGLRLAGYTSSDADNVTRVANKLWFYDAHFKIVSLTGSVCADGLHLQILRQRQRRRRRRRRRQILLLIHLGRGERGSSD